MIAADSTATGELSWPSGLLRKGLSAPGLLRNVRACFEALDDPVQGRGLCLAECLMSGLAVFGLKYPSLLQFDRDARTDELVRANLKRLYGIERAPCDTALREASRRGGPAPIACGVQAHLHAAATGGRGWRGSPAWTGIICCRWTGRATSRRRGCIVRTAARSTIATVARRTTIRCWVRCWCIRNKREVFALAPEPIMKGDGAKKNDCERNAAKRLLSDVRRRASALEAGGGGRRAGVERTVYQALEGAGDAIHPGGEARRPRGVVRVGGGHTTAQAQCGEARRAPR